MKCQHKHISRGISFQTGKYFTFCQDCNKKWQDGGKRWEAKVENDYHSFGPTGEPLHSMKGDS